MWRSYFVALLPRTRGGSGWAARLDAARDHFDQKPGRFSTVYFADRLKRFDLGPSSVSSILTRFKPHKPNFLRTGKKLRKTLV